MTSGWLSVLLVCVIIFKVTDGLPLEDSLTSLKSSDGEKSSSTGGSEENSPDDGGGGDSSLSRDKRTIGILRQVFPGLSQIVDRKIQMLTRFLFRFIGRLVLRGGAGGGGGGTASTGDGGGRKIQITLPTFPPSEDGDEEEDEEENGTGSTTESEATTLGSPTTTIEAVNRRPLRSSGRLSSFFKEKSPLRF